MNIEKIQKLSGQHKLLKDFHDACNHNDVQLEVKKTAHSYGGITLDYATTKLILSDVRVSLLAQMKRIEGLIVRETSVG